MLLITHNPTPTSNIKHNILNNDKHFVVEYICLVTGRTCIENYSVPLTTKEIEAEYDYISF